MTTMISNYEIQSGLCFFIDKASKNGEKFDTNNLFLNIKCVNKNKNRGLVIRLLFLNFAKLFISYLIVNNAPSLRGGTTKQS